MSVLRQATVAGQFYPSDSAQLRNQLKQLVDTKAEKINAIGCMLPHAGYVYSGAVAGITVSNLRVRHTLIVLGPNHTGVGRPFGVMCTGIWQTPLGDVKINSTLARHLLRNSPYLEEDSFSHLQEHSIEVLLPFFQYFRNDFYIVPVAVMGTDFEAFIKIGTDIAKTLISTQWKDSTLLVASTDMTHYESASEVEKKDKTAIEAILELNEDKLFDRIRQYKISMCGYGPVIILMRALKLLGAKRTELIKYQTSGDITGDTDSVVGYAGIIVE